MGVQLNFFHTTLTKCTGAVNVNFTGMMKKRFMSGKIGLYDLVPTEEGREKFKVESSERKAWEGNYSSSRETGRSIMLR